MRPVYPADPWQSGTGLPPQEAFSGGFPVKSDFIEKLFGAVRMLAIASRFALPTACRRFSETKEAARAITPLRAVAERAVRPAWRDAGRTAQDRLVPASRREVMRDARPSSIPSAFNGSHKIVRDKDCLFEQFCARVASVNGREFMAKVRKLARRNGIAVRFDRTRGKGSHGTLYYGDRHTVVKDRRKPLKTGTLRGMCRQLGIDPDL